jgi:hypothetical protein
MSEDMKRVLAICAIATTSCASAHHPPPGATSTVASAATGTPSPIAGEAAAHDLHLWIPGDYVVYRFSGKFRTSPLSMTERVVAQSGDVTTFDFTTVDGKTSRTLRVRMGGSSSEPKVVSVARIEKDEELPAPVDAYDSMLAKTVLAADRNDGLVSSEDVEITVGGRSIRCKRNAYRVAVGKRTGTMTVLASDSFPWGDVGGELRTDDGAVLYKAEVVDAGHTVASPDRLARAR